MGKCTHKMGCLGFRAFGIKYLLFHLIGFQSWSLDGSSCLSDANVLYYGVIDKPFATSHFLSVCLEDLTALQTRLYFLLCLTETWCLHILEVALFNGCVSKPVLMMLYCTCHHKPFNFLKSIIASAVLINGTKNART